MESGFQFVVCRYVPDVVRDEATNIGVILHSHLEGITACRFSQAFPSRAQMHRDPDLQILRAIIDDLEERFSLEVRYERDDLPFEERRDPSLLAHLAKTYCNQIQFTKPRSLVAENLPAALDHLYRTYVATPGETGRVTHNSVWVRTQFGRLIAERGLRSKVITGVTLADKWGAPINLDFQWQNGAVNFVQALSLNDQREGDIITKARLWQANYDLIHHLPRYASAEITTVIQPPMRPTKNYDTAWRILADQSDVVELAEAQRIVDKIAQYGHTLN